MDTVEGMRVFTAVAQSGSFSAAARRLGISKALASKYVTLLERRLGVRLFQRTTRAVTLTEAGRDAFARALAILAQLDELENEAASSSARICGTLRISGPPVFGEEVLAGALASFLAKHPALRAELILEERYVDLVKEGFDVAIRVGTLPGSRLVARRIAEQPFVFCATPDYLARRGTPASPVELVDHDCVLDVALSPTAQWELAGPWGRRVAVRPRVKLNSGRAVAELVRAGAGIGLVALAYVREDLASGRLARLFAGHDAYRQGVYALYPHRAHLPAKVRAFVDHLVAELSGPRRARARPAGRARGTGSRKPAK